MRFRTGILALVLIGSLSACGDDDKKETSDTPSSNPPASSEPSGPATGAATFECAKFLATRAKAIGLATQALAGTDVPQSEIDAVESEIASLEADVPDEIKDSLDGVEEAIGDLAEIYKDGPQSVDTEKLQDAQERLRDNSAVLDDYLRSNGCTF